MTSRFRFWLIRKLLGKQPFVANVKINELGFAVMNITAERENKKLFYSNITIIEIGDNTDEHR
jgi:hypothetical protein